MALAFTLVSAAGLEVYAGGLGWKTIKGEVAIDSRMEDWKRGRYSLLKKVCHDHKDGHCNNVNPGTNFLIIGDSHAPDAIVILRGGTSIQLHPQFNRRMPATRCIRFRDLEAWASGPREVHRPQ